MTRAPALPERLRYLQPFRRKFARGRAQELNEDSGSAVLMPLMSKRIEGFSVENAAALLQQDHAALEQWLNSLGGKGDPLHFALGFSITAAPQELAKLIKEETEKPPEPALRLHIELPPGAKLRRVDGAGDSGKLIVLKGLWLAIDATSEEALRNLITHKDSGPYSPERSESDVRFGEVTGRKLTIKGESWRGPYKKLVYGLTVPGGQVYAYISAPGKKNELNWDETPFEQCFHTLRVETRPALPRADFRRIA